ncbi:MAG: GNAT family N-acetyltransferase [Pseudomonadales bacterium]|nr:GNAT family N-acetyltransferase [Pseudomonadales bacterium]
MSTAITQPFEPEQIPQFQAGHYSVQFATNEAQIAKAQALRYRVFYQENQGKPTDEMVRLGREIDEWDDVAYHIVVTDQNANDAVVGTLRLVSNYCLLPSQTFYTEKAFKLNKLRGKYDRILELSRYCIDPAGRSGVILMLIWKYAMKFIIDNHYQLMLGCASFHGTDISKHREILTYLYQNNLAPDEHMPEPIVPNAVAINNFHNHPAPWDHAKKAVPTLLRGYLKLGAKISDTAIIDPQFNTVFVCIYVDANDMLRDSHTLVPR